MAGLGVKALEGLIASMFALDLKDIDSLMDPREIIEINAARLAALRADENDLEELIDAHEMYKKTDSEIRRGDDH